MKVGIIADIHGNLPASEWGAAPVVILKRCVDDAKTVIRRIQQYGLPVATITGYDVFLIKQELVLRRRIYKYQEKVMELTVIYPRGIYKLRLCS